MTEGGEWFPSQLGVLGVVATDGEEREGIIACIDGEKVLDSSVNSF